MRISTFKQIEELQMKLKMANIELPENFKLHLSKEENHQYLVDFNPRNSKSSCCGEIKLASIVTNYGEVKVVIDG
jgi:hypothetical protein